MKVVEVAVGSDGVISDTDLRAKCEAHSDNLAAIMITYPSTYGVFEEGVDELCELVHSHGGQVYLDGANMNAQVNLVQPGKIGADVSHLNLHKTFCIPHGGGGPGMGPIGVKAHLSPFLPKNPLTAGATDKPGDFASCGAPFGSSLITTISWAYMRMMGAHGLMDASKYAILNANYMMARLAPHYKIRFTGTHGRCAHEFIIDVAEFKEAAGIEAADIAKRLQDFGLHAPTVSWPLSTALMIEPTESESRTAMDEYCDALIEIRAEITEIIEGRYTKDNNVLKHAPHTLEATMSDRWERPYPRSKAAYPLPHLVGNKMWPTVSRVDDVFGDKNLKTKLAR
jgi:glycine dehydrogenase